MHPDLKSQWPYITEHYQRIGLEHTENVIWNVSYDQLEKYGDYKPSVFFVGKDTNAHLKQQAWFDVVQFINSKNNFMTLANILGIPVPTTYCYSDKFNLHKFERFTYPCYLKSAVSVAGKGIYRCDTPHDLVYSLTQFPDNTPLQIQEEVNTNVFLNLQFILEQT